MTRPYVMTLKQARDLALISKNKRGEMVFNSCAYESGKMDIAQREYQDKLKTVSERRFKNYIVLQYYNHQSNPQLGQWVNACALQIDNHLSKGAKPLVTWFESGDLDSMRVFLAIIEVAKATPGVAHVIKTCRTDIIRGNKTEIPLNLKFIVVD